MLTNIKGVGPKTIQNLSELGINSISNLLTYYPYRYNFYNPISIEKAPENENILINGIISSPVKVFYIKKNLNKLSFKINSNNKLINVVIFNRAFIKPQLIIGKTISLLGKYIIKNNTFTANDIKLTPILEEKIEGVYHLNYKIKKATFNNIMTNALRENYYIPNYIPDYLMEEYNFLDKISAIKEIHLPTSLESLKKAKLMLIYEELFSFMLKINYMKLYKNKIEKSYIKKFDKYIVEDFINNLPFKLTKDQVNAIEDISKDFNSNKRINRLLLGDVGSGKTIIAFISLYMNYLAGYQGIMMAPTEILAEQHYDNMMKLFNGKMRIALLTSSISKKERLTIIEKINNNEIDVLIGTHSVLNDDIKFKNLGLVITDEQHRFGVNQRKKLAQKGELCDVIYMSATPIPRTFALTLYGDMDISEIKSKPQNRKEIQTKVYTNNEIKNVLDQMLNEIKANHQIYVVAPLIEDDEETSLESVNKLYQKLNTAFNKKIPIDILHGKLSSKEKNQIMDNFKSGKSRILISTTVIEVGIDIKNATMMVIFNAERFGLATLHQLRGRIGRNYLESKCILISDLEVERLKILEESNDGFYISEKDFELRGSGDLFGIRQSGDMTFKLANLTRDYKILLKCKDDSEKFLTEHLNEIDKYSNIKDLILSISFDK